MYCPKCGADAESGQNYCRKCGVNMSLVTKAVRIGDTIARGDSGLLPKIKEMVGDLKLDDMSIQIGNQLDKITSEVEQGARSSWGAVEASWREPKRPKTPEERRAKLVEQGFSSLLGGIVFAIVLYATGNLVNLQLPVDWVERAPFDAYAALRLAWLVGLFPVTGGIAQLFSAMSIRPGAAEPLQLEATSAEPAKTLGARATSLAQRRSTTVRMP